MFAGLTAITKEAWNTANDTEDKKKSYKRYHWLKSAIQ
jgi:hypothetical protein